jgi:hypothetical protein
LLHISVEVKHQQCPIDRLPFVCYGCDNLRSRFQTAPIDVPFDFPNGGNNSIDRFLSVGISLVLINPRTKLELDRGRGLRLHNSSVEDA